MTLVALGKPTRLTVLAGLPLVVAGEAVRIWASGYIVKLSELTTAGPFALCRNPMYTGSFLANAGYLTMCNRLDLWIAGVVLFWLFHGGAVAFEEKMLRERHGQEFVDYCSRVPRFVPRFTSLLGQGRFSWAQLVRNDEYRGAIGAMLIVGLLSLKAVSGRLLPVGLFTLPRP